MHYTASAEIAFDSIEHIMRDVPCGWMMRYIHSNGASFFFMMVYLHMARSIWYCSYGAPRFIVWYIGVTVYAIMMAVAFMGYVLPWGQMSLWGATVITNLFSAIPFIGNELVYFLWGGYSVSHPTLNRFFSLHYMAAFALSAFVILHLLSLHETESNNPATTASKDNTGKANIGPHYLEKDGVGFGFFIICFVLVLFFSPNTLGHPDNYIAANELVTPAHIVPEWYFLPFYAILRSIPDKELGVLCMAAAILVFYVLPFLHVGPMRGPSNNTPLNIQFWMFAFIWLGLLWVGSQQAVEPYITIGQCLTIAYFCWFFLVLPVTPLITSKK
jgi:ubiquinol-cytochrome c reductase cytochrome b subunit